MSKSTTYEELVSILQTVVKYDVNKYSVDLRSISIVPGTTCRTIIKNTDDVQFMLGEYRVTPQNTEPNLEPIHEVDNEVNIDPVDHVLNTEEEEEPFQMERCGRRVHRFCCSAPEMAETSEVRSNMILIMPQCASLRGFRRYMRPVIAVDGTHMKRRFGVQYLLQLHKMGANKCIQLLLGLLLGTGFLKCSFMSLIPYVADTFMKIFRSNFTKDVATIIDKTVRSYTKLKYNRHMEDLRNLHQNAFDYVNDIGPLNWSRVHYLEQRYRMMTTNVAKCIKSCLKFARQLPMLTLTAFIRNMLQRWFHDHHRAVQPMRHQLTDVAHFVIFKCVKKCGYMIISPVDWNISSVKRSGKQWTVDLAQKTCTCNKF
ncbi:hypothetical protein Ddye_010124 [Dipteronia dyeriana]|uniref:Uncharacterized protein n=1 Tax=Dipteronia dyeriana TaxID=168575 RepID=A0AAE0CMX7_9ROSI|nr:hypothetical protein Ddye_010124 [Dipteronia dyeriana]